MLTRVPPAAAAGDVGFEIQIFVRGFPEGRLIEFELAGIVRDEGGAWRETRVDGPRGAGADAVEVARKRLKRRLPHGLAIGRGAAGQSTAAGMPKRGINPRGTSGTEPSEEMDTALRVAKLHRLAQA